MQSFVVLALCLVATASASVFGREEGENLLDRWEEDLAPKPCCTPMQWEGYLGGVTGYFNFRTHRPGSVAVNTAMSYDGKGKKVAATMMVPKHPIIKLIMDYSVGKTYIINNSTQHCKVTKTKRPFEPACIPKGAKFIGSFYQGAGGDKLNENCWLIVKKGVTATVTVTRKGCIPVGEQISGKTRDVGYSTSMGFVNITPGIKDPSVFTPPSFCKSVEEDELNAGEDHPILEYLRQKFTQE